MRQPNHRVDVLLGVGLSIGLGGIRTGNQTWGQIFSGRAVEICILDDSTLFWFLGRGAPMPCGGILKIVPPCSSLHSHLSLLFRR